MKPALSPQTTGFLPRSRSRPWTSRQDLGLGDDGADDLDEVLHGRGVEEVDADDPAGLGVGRGDLGDAQRGGVGREHRVVADDAVEQPEDRLLDLERLHHGLDDEVGHGEVLHVGGEGDPAQQLGLLLLGHLLALHRAPGGVLEVLAAALDAAVVELDADHGVAVAGEDLGDAGAHGAQADHADGGELAGSLVSHGRMLPRGSRPRGCGNRHVRGGRGAYDDHLVARSDRARPHHLGAEPAQPARLALGAVDEGHRVLAEAGDELGAAVVGLVGHHDHGPLGAADVELAPRGEVGVGEVEVEEHLVAGQHLALRVLGEELHEPVAHQVELHVGVRRAVRRPPAPARRPRVTDEALGDVEVADLQHLALPGRGSADTARSVPTSRGAASSVGRNAVELRGRAVRAEHPRIQTGPGGSALRQRAGRGSGSSAGTSAKPGGRTSAPRQRRTS